MTQVRWFLMKGAQISGPFSESRIEDELKQNPNSLVWGKGLTEWLTPAQWRTEDVRKLSSQDKASSQTQWKFKLEEHESESMNFNDLLFTIKKLNEYDGLELWSSDSKNWKSIFQMPTIADQLGVTRRQHPRVPIMGTLQVEFEEKERGGSSTVQNFRVISISEGGFGLSDTKGLSIGQGFKATLTSANLVVPIPCQCEVVYVGADGYVGVHFINLPAEHKGAIIEYVNKFDRT